MELEALLTLLSQETNGLEAFYGSIDSATTDTAAREVDLWKTLDKHCSALAKVLQKVIEKHEKPNDFCFFATRLSMSGHHTGI